VKILKKIHHENILNLIETKQNEENMYIITEFCEYGDLDRIFNENF